MNKVELEAKLESLTDEINFLRSIYEEVRPVFVAFLPFSFLFNIRFVSRPECCVAFGSASAGWVFHEK